MPKTKKTSYRAARRDNRYFSDYRASRTSQTGESIEPVFAVLGDKIVDLTDLSKLVPVVDSPFRSVSTGNNSDKEKDKQKRTQRKKIEYTSLSEIKPVVFGAIPDEKEKKSKLNNIGDILKSILKR